MRKDFVITCMKKYDPKKEILLMNIGHGVFQMTREEALYYACAMAKAHPNVTYMVMSLRGCIPHEVIVQHDVLVVEGLE